MASPADDLAHRLRGHAEIDDELVEGVTLFLSLRFDEVDGLSADHAAIRSRIRVDVDAHTRKDGGVDAADGGHG